MFKFELHGVPVPQQQTRFSCVGNKPRTWDPSSKDKAHIQWQVRSQWEISALGPSETLKGPIELVIAFFLPIPKGTSAKMATAMKNRTVLPSKKPDIDNLAYLVTNSLKKIVYEDDNQIVVQRLYKVYDSVPKTIILVKPIEQSQKVGIHEIDI